MRCSTPKEFPKRVKTHSGKVIHAARITISAPYTYYSNEHGAITRPEKKTVFTACYQTPTNSLQEVDNTEVITCKKCMKAMGMLDKATFTKRYVLCEIESGYFFRKAGYRKNWVNNFADATLYKVRAAAEKQGNILEYFDIEGNEMSRKAYYSILQAERRPKGMYMKERFAEEKYKIRIVNLTLDK